MVDAVGKARLKGREDRSVVDGHDSEVTVMIVVDNSSLCLP